MNIGDKVRFLNDVGGGKISGFRAGGIVLVEDEDGFDVPVHESEIVVIETNSLNFVKKPKPAPKVEFGAEPASTQPASMKGKDILREKSASRAEENDEVDENLEARVIRLEMTVKKLQMQLERLLDDKAAKEKQKVEARQARKQDKNEIIEVDLHADEVLETTAGMSAGDIKQFQLKVFHKTMDEHLKEKGRRIVFIHGKGDGVLRKAIIDDLKYYYKSCEYQDASFQQYGFGATMVIIH